MIKSITRLQLDRIKHRVETGQGTDFIYDDEVVDLVVSRWNQWGQRRMALT